jgi:hypothetical protein
MFLTFYSTEIWKPWLELDDGDLAATQLRTAAIFVKLMTGASSDKLPVTSFENIRHSVPTHWTWGQADRGTQLGNQSTQGGTDPSC